MHGWAMACRCLGLLQDLRGDLANLWKATCAHSSDGSLSMQADEQSEIRHNALLTPGMKSRDPVDQWICAISMGTSRGVHSCPLLGQHLQYYIRFRHKAVQTSGRHPADWRVTATSRLRFHSPPFRSHTQHFDAVTAGRCRLICMSSDRHHDPFRASTTDPARIPDGTHTQFPTVRRKRTPPDEHHEVPLL